MRARLQVGAAIADDLSMDSRAIQAAADMGTASYRSFADATRAVLDLLETQVPGAAVFLAHLDRGHEIHRIVDTRNGGEFGLRSNLALPLSDSFCVHMADDRAPRLCNDVAAHPIYGRVAAQSRFGAGAYLGTPLELSDGSRVGSLSAMSREPMVFRAEHEQLFGMLARVLAYELERETQERDVRRLNDSLRSQAHGMAAVERATRALSADADPRRAILQAACDAAGAPVAFLLEPKGRELVSTAMYGVEMAPVTIQAREESPRGVTTAFASLESYFVADARDHPALADPLVQATMARSALFEPVVREGAVSGVIIIVWRDAVSAPSESLNAVLRLLAAHAAAAIEHATLRDRLGELALSDPLTGLATERMFEVELPRELARARRAESPVCVALFDLDALGAFNMLRGEREGDRLLKETGASWSGALRDVDLLARFDGGTFCALLPGCMLGEACEVVDRVRSLTPRLQTASAGVAEWNREEPAELLLGRARGAMASAKAAGRDITLPAD
jgi:diguanylate cyclase (GGDEF)-like protein